MDFLNKVERIIKKLNSMMPTIEKFLLQFFGLIGLLIMLIQSLFK